MEEAKEPYDRIIKRDLPEVRNGIAGLDFQLRKQEEEAAEHGTNSRKYRDRQRWIEHAANSTVDKAEETLERTKAEHKGFLRGLFGGGSAAD